MSVLGPFVAEHKPPPVNKRPKCAGCGERLRPWIVSCNVDGGVEWGTGSLPHTHRRWGSPGSLLFYHAYGYFCKLRCATDWANRQVSRGSGVVR